MQTVLSPPTSLWCADGVSVSIDGPGVQQVCQFDKPFVLLGASSQCDVVLPLRDDLPVALYLHVTDDAIAWLDLATHSGQWRSGTFYRSGCLVWRGYHIALERIPAINPTPPREVECRSMTLPGDSLADAPVFDVEHHGERIARAKLTSAVTLVGQSERCRLRLRNRHVSHDHCLFYVNDCSAWVVDLLSREGTYVRGRRVAASPVLAGDVVTLGKPSMTLVRWSHAKSKSHATDAASDSGVAVSADSTPVFVVDGGSDAREPAPCSAPAASPAVASELAAENPAAENSAAENSAAADPAFQPDNGALPALPSLTPTFTDTTVDPLALRDTVLEPPPPRNGVSQPPAALAELTGDPRVAGIIDSALSVPSATVNPQSSLPDPSLDRLIVRHKRNYRRTMFRWSIASSVILAAFLSAVVWGSRNLDFYYTGPGLEAERPNVEREDNPPPREGASTTRVPWPETAPARRPATLSAQPNESAALTVSAGRLE